MTAPVPTPSPARRTFATYFDSNYLSRGIVMLRSLLHHDPGARICVLCLDTATASVLDAWFQSRVTTVPLDRLHRLDERLPATKPTRGKWPFIATHKAPFMRYLLAQSGPLDWVAFVDADTCFYSSPQPLFDDIAGASVALSPHRFPRFDNELRQYGRFNAGFICARNDPIARRCFTDWTDECIAWCHKQLMPDGRYMNQGYLNRWPERYPNVAVIEHPGVNLAPWNIGRHRIEIRDGIATVDGRPLVFFHFSAIERKESGEWHAHHAANLSSTPAVMADLYRPYIDQVETVRRELIRRFGIDGTGSVRFAD